MRKLIIVCFLFIAGITASRAQSLKPLRIGDTIPDISFKTFYEPGGYCPSVQRLRGKMIILDFWNVGCKGCIDGMPHMDSLQQMFKDSLQVIYLTRNTQAEVLSVFSKIKVKKPQVPFVVDNTIYYDSLFPHVGDPLQVWINRNGIINAITGGHNATPEHISEMLKNDKINLSLRSELNGFGYSSSLLDEAAGRLRSYTTYYSLFFKGLKQVTGKEKLTVRKDSVTGFFSLVQSINTSAYRLIHFAWCDKFFDFQIVRNNLLHNNRIVVKTSDSSWYRHPANGNDLDLWNELYTYSYELSVPPKEGNGIFELMRKDLQFYLPYKMSLEKRVMECLVLKRLGKRDKLRTQHKNDRPDYGYRSGFYASNISLQASLLPSLIINCQALKTPIIDDTNYRTPVDILLNCDLYDMPALERELKRYGLTLIKEKRKTAVLVIRDK